jgi:hypothetical protein
MPKNQDTAAGLQAFYELLSTLHKGELGEEIAEGMKMASDAARSRRKKAKVSISISMVPGPATNEDNDIVYLHGEVKVTLPPVQRGHSTWFAWSDGLLRTRREAQASMFDEAPRLVTGQVIPKGEDFEDDRDERIGS